jgi:hypothetical protein
MPTQYVKVHFPTRRQVYVDDDPSGYTNKTFLVGEGRHRFDLGPRRNYTPAEYVRVVKGTTAETPLELSFRRKADA